MRHVIATLLLLSACDLVTIDPSAQLPDGGSTAVVNCTHDPLEEGEALWPTCQSCVEDVCADRPECCSDAPAVVGGPDPYWSSECVELAEVWCAP